MPQPQPLANTRPLITPPSIDPATVALDAALADAGSLSVVLLMTPDPDDCSDAVWELFDSVWVRLLTAEERAQHRARDRAYGQRVREMAAKLPAPNRTSLLTAIAEAERVPPSTHGYSCEECGLEWTGGRKFEDEAINHDGDRDCSLAQRVREELGW